jgi:hypothetical protein
MLSTAPQTPAPGVYTVPPPQPKDRKPGQLKQQQVDEYFDKGFVLIPKFFTDDEIQPVIEVKLYNGKPVDLLSLSL